MLNLIVAMSGDHVIGLHGDMPWKLSADLQRFKKITTGHTVMMGRKTWESIPAKFRPLPGRRNLVVSGQEDYTERVPEGVGVASSFEGAMEAHRVLAQSPIGHLWGDLFVIGGATIYQASLAFVDRLYVTFVAYEGEGDTFFPEDPFENFKPVSAEEHVPVDDKNSHASRFLVMERR